MDMLSPSLDSRFQLAQQLAACIYSFSIVRWFHKDFNSHNIFLFRDTSASSKIMLDSPFVSGFSIARPDAKEQVSCISFPAYPEPRDLYRHPDLHHESGRPRYHVKYEFYSLGLVLLEIGLWKALNLQNDKNGFKDRVTDRVRKDLPFCMGERYTNVVLYCLTCADGTDESRSTLETLYECVILELAKCQ